MSFHLPRRRSLLWSTTSALFAAAVALVTGAGCSSECEAACVSTVTARGAVAVEPGTAARLRFCLDGACSECETVLEEGAVGCDDIGGAMTGDQLELWQEVFEDPEVGQQVEVSVTAIDTGEVLGEVSQAIAVTTQGSTCGNVCESALVTWDDTDA